MVQFGSLVNAKTQLESVVEGLRSEEKNLTAKVKLLKEEANGLVLRIGFEVSHGRKINQMFLKDLELMINKSIKTTDESLRSIEQASLCVTERVVKGLQTLDSTTKQQFDLYQKIGAAAEFSLLIKAARGQYVDIDELKGSVIRAMDIMHSRINSTINKGTKIALQEMIERLESEMFVLT